MLVNFFSILCNLRHTRKAGPVGRLLVVEGDVDVHVVLELVELVRDAVREENEVDLRRSERWYRISKGILNKKM